MKQSLLMFRLLTFRTVLQHKFTVVLRIAQCESGLNPNAYNPISIGGSHAEGVFQILYPSTWSGTPQAASSPYDAWANIQAAHAIFMRDGYSWREWTCQ